MAILQINWLGPCPTCQNTNLTVTTKKGNEKYLHEGDTVSCHECGREGRIENVDAETVECAWTEDEGSYCQCDNPDCGNWFTVSKIGATCQECNKGSMQPQDIDPY